jgi:hypothetical protein
VTGSVVRIRIHYVGDQPKTLVTEIVDRVSTGTCLSNTNTSPSARRGRMIRGDTFGTQLW